MSPFANAAMPLVNTIGSFVLLIILLRFLLQLVRADFYNPISQFIVKATNPILVPLRRIIPSVGSLDIASLLLLYTAEVLLIAAIFWVSGSSFIPWISLLIWAPIAIFSLILNLYFWGLILVVIASWIAPNSYNPALILVNQLIEPMMRPVRRILPNMGGLDFSPLAAFLIIQLTEILILGPLVNALGIPRGIVLGL
jgi:YggT family protein